jgi:hypothetical protein
MAMKNKFAEAIKMFGLFYFFINILLCISLVIFAIQAFIKTQISPGFIVLLLPIVGIFSGYWMRYGKYGWWRILIISISLFLSIAIVFTAIFISPKLEQQKHQKFLAQQKTNIPTAGINDMFDALYEDDMAGVRQKLDQGINVNAKNDTGQTPLHATQNIDILNLLISKGADVKAVDDTGMTPLFNKDIDLIKILVEAGADIQHTTPKGNTTLIWYAYSGYIEAIQYMVSLGVDVNKKNHDGQTAYDIAETFGHLNLLEYLKSIGAKPGKYRSKEYIEPLDKVKTKF